MSEYTRAKYFALCLFLLHFLSDIYYMINELKCLTILTIDTWLN